MFRGLLISFHLAGAAISVALLLSTWHATDIISSKARQFAVEKSRSYADPLAWKVRETLDRQVIGKLIRGDVRERLEAELQSYQSDPDAWIERLAMGGAGYAQRFDFPEVTQPLARKTLDAIVAGLGDLKSRVQSTYQDLLADLRIFAISNLIAFLLAAVMAWCARTPQARHWLLAYSAVMLVVIVASICAYIDQNWFWNFLLNRFTGWVYPLVLGISTMLAFARIAPELSKSRPNTSS